MPKISTRWRVWLFQKIDPPIEGNEQKWSTNNAREELSSTELEIKYLNLRIERLEKEIPRRNKKLTMSFPTLSFWGV